MGPAYTSKEIVEMAVQAKERGAELYLVLARNSENYHVGQFFTELAKDEHRHKMKLEKWLNDLGGEKREEAYPGERSLYLKALVDANTFVCDETKKRSMEKTISEEDALQAGINFEKDFMLFLHDLKRQVSAEAARTIDELIDEEICHLKDMFRMKDKGAV